MGAMDESRAESYFTLRPNFAHGEEQSDASVRETDDVPSSVLPLLVDGMHAESETDVLQHFPWRETSDPGWIRIKTVMGSGASENVVPP